MKLKQELAIAIQQNPGSTGPLNGLGSTLETQNKPDRHWLNIARPKKSTQRFLVPSPTPAAFSS